jgi:multiple sugar transport system ATP-binding protein
VTTVYVTHDQIEAVALSHRVAVMRDGKLEQVGTFAHLYESPINIFVATFIGVPTINLFNGYVRDWHWQGDNFGGYAIRHDLEDGTRVTLGIRAEHLRLAENGTPGTVMHITPFYAERFQLVELKAYGEHWHISLPPDYTVKVGDTLRCQPDPEHIHYFDTRTGARIG